MTVSVVISTKDRLDTLRGTLPSVLAQPEAQEVIIVIDGSTDGTREYLTELSSLEPRIRVLDNGVNRGIPYSKNRAIAATTNDLVFIAEDDLELTDGFLTTLCGHLASSEIDVLGPRVVWRGDSESQDQARRRSDEITGDFVDRKWIGVRSGMAVDDDMTTLLTNSPVLARRATLLDVPFDENYVGNFYREETDFQVGLQERGYSLGVCPHALCFNIMINRDKGGVHAVEGVRRARSTIKNNGYFLRKHSDFVRANFGIDDIEEYQRRFAAYTYYEETAKRFAIRVKYYLIARAKRVKNRFARPR